LSKTLSFVYGAIEEYRKKLVQAECATAIWHCRQNIASSISFAHASRNITWWGWNGIGKNQFQCSVENFLLLITVFQNPTIIHYKVLSLPCINVLNLFCYWLNFQYYVIFLPSFSCADGPYFPFQSGHLVNRRVMW
jgi:hypothetical protein